MKYVKKSLCFILVLLMAVNCVRDKQCICAKDTEKVRYMYFSGILEHNEDKCEDYYLNYIRFEENVDVKVTLELDISKIDLQEECEYLGGHVQFALTKDEAHSLWMDDCSLYKNMPTSYVETFSLYKGYYTLEMHLVRDEFAFVPFKITLQITNNSTLPEVDSKATIWLEYGWDNITIFKGKENLTIDMYQRIGISSWNTIKRTDLIYTCNNTKIATINKRGILKIKRAGAVKVRITMPNGQSVASRMRILE